MNKCLLCKEKAADKLGSHIVPHFLLKRIENVGGNPNRGYELGWVINGLDTQSHFGRSVATQEIFGELTDEEIQKNHHPLIVDNIFCTACEEKLASIESEYALTLKKIGSQIYSSGIKSQLAFLFWASIIWRISINKKLAVQLTKGQNEILRRILNRSLQIDLKNIDLDQLKKSSDIKRISYKLIRCPNFSKTEPTYMSFHKNFRYPYSIIIDEFILFFTFNNNYNDYLKKDFFGIKNEIFTAPTNKFQGEEQIYPIDNEKMSTINTLLIEQMRNQYLKNLNLFWDRAYKAIGGEGELPDSIKQLILEELKSKEKLPGRKWTSEDIENSTRKILKNYGLI